MRYKLTVKLENLRYCERFLEFLSDLQSQLPTRRYVNTLLQDLHTLRDKALNSFQRGWQRAPS